MANNYPSKPSADAHPRPGFSLAHPVYVVVRTPSPAPGYVASPDPAVNAAQQTAQYTLDLAVATLLLFIGTIAALIVGEVQRRLSVAQAENTRNKQFEADTALQDRQLAAVDRQREIDAQNRETERQASNVVALAQVIAILQSYQRTINILLMAPHYPIASRSDTMRVLFQLMFSDNIVAAIPEENRPSILRSIIKAQETLQGASENQATHDSMLEALEREGQTMALFADRLKVADADRTACYEAVAREGDRQKRTVLEEYARAAQRRLEDLKGSPDAYVAGRFVTTSDARKAKLDALYPNITKNAEDAKADLIATRALLGDHTDMDFIPIED